MITEGDQVAAAWPQQDEYFFLTQTEQQLVQQMVDQALGFRQAVPSSDWVRDTLRDSGTPAAQAPRRTGDRTAQAVAYRAEDPATVRASDVLWQASALRGFGSGLKGHQEMALRAPERRRPQPQPQQDKGTGREPPSGAGRGNKHQDQGFQCYSSIVTS